MEQWILFVFFPVFFVSLVALIHTLFRNKTRNRKQSAEEGALNRPFFQSIPSGVCLIRPRDGRVLFTNSRLEELLGYREGELIGEELNRIIVGDDRASNENIQRIRSELSVHGAWNGEIRNRKKNGEEIWCRVAISLLEHPVFGTVWISIHADITELVTTQRALRESGDRFRSFFEKSPVGILLTKPTGEILSVNSACCKILRMTEEEILRAGREPLIDRTDRRVVQLLKEREEQREVHAGRLTMIRKGGEKFEAEVSSMLFQDEEGNVLNCLILDDVSERKRMEDDLLEEKARLYAIVELLHDGVFVTDESGKIIHWNRALEGITGIPNHEALNKPILDLLCMLIVEENPEKQRCEQLKREVFEFFQNGKAPWCDRDIVWSYRHPVKGRLSIRSHASAIPGRDGNMLVATLQDVTEQEALQAALREGDEQLRSLIQNFHVGVVLYEIGSGILLSNPRAMQLLGMSDELVTEKIVEDSRWQFIHEDGSLFRFEERPMRQAITTRRAVTGITLGIVRPEENTLWLLVNAEPQFDPDGNVKQVINTFIDITERHEMELRMRHLADYDQLTQLPNRRLLDDRLDQAMVASKRSHQYGAVLFLDLDDFKPLNDRYGHAVGDLFLREAAQRLKNCVRESDTVTRFGGDEFVVILHELSDSREESNLHAQAIAEKICFSLSQSAQLVLPGKGDDEERNVEYRTSASVGVALFLGTDVSSEDLIRWADMAMYASKQNGRNQVTFYHTEMEASHLTLQAQKRSNAMYETDHEGSELYRRSSGWR